MSPAEEVRHWKSQAVRQAARRHKLHDDAYPDIGWGKSWDSCVDDALKELGLQRVDVNPELLIDPALSSRFP